MAKTIYPKKGKTFFAWDEPTIEDVLNGRIFDCNRRLYHFRNGSKKITSEAMFVLEQKQIRFDLDWLKRIKSGVSKVTAYYLTVLSQFKK